MAQAKSKTSAKRSGGSKKSQARSRGSSSKASKSRKARSSPKARNSHSSRKPATTAVSEAADKATSVAGNAASKTTSAVGSAAGKAKMPLIASGAALAGVAGGAVLGVRQARRHPRGFAKAAKGVGALGVQAGHLASDLQRNREGANGNGYHRSPLEVVLEGLTARR